MNKRAIALLRVSSRPQEMSRQRADISRLEKKFGLTIVETVELDGVSGRFVRENPRFMQVLEDIRRRADVDGIALSAIDRFFRTNRYGDTAIFEPLADSRKLIWSAAEGEVDVATDAGFSTCMTAALKSGSEWRELRRRTWDGREEKRREKKHPGGAHTLPRGVTFDRATGKWAYCEPHASNIVRMYELLLAGESLHGIASKIGGWTFQGVRGVLRNRIWAFGTRFYPANDHREEAYEVKVIDTPLIPVSIWQAAQRELDSRKDSWRQTKKPPQFLLSGLLKCECGRPWYGQSGTAGYTYYRCGSRHYKTRKDSGPACGACSLRQKFVDAVVLKKASESFTDAAVLAELLKGIAEPPAQARTSAKEIARLEGRRERILEQRSDGLITRDDCIAKVAVIDRELQTARAAIHTAGQTPAIDPKRLVAGMVRAFAGLDRKPFEFQRALLSAAIREIVVDGRTIVQLTFRGRFLGRVLGEQSVKLATRSNTASSPRSLTAMKPKRPNGNSTSPATSSATIPSAFPKSTSSAPSPTTTSASSACAPSKTTSSAARPKPMHPRKSGWPTTRNSTTSRSICSALTASSSARPKP
jgi:hypothetical protein